MTTIASPSTVVERPLARGGSVSIATVDTEVRVRGIDGDVARIRLVDGDVADEFRIDAAPDLIEIRPIRRWPLGWRRCAGPLEIDVPRDARVDVRSASGSVFAIDLAADTRVRTASGGVELAGIGGSVRVDAVSGAIRVHSPTAVKLALSSVSGRIEVVAATLASIEARSMSAGIRVMGRLRGKGPFSLESVSGDVTLGTDGEVRLTASTLSGDVRSELAGHEDATSGGGRTIALGGAGPAVTARTVSGRIRLVPWAGDSPADAAPSTTVRGEPGDLAQGSPASSPSSSLADGQTGPDPVETVAPTGDPPTGDAPTGDAPAGDAPKVATDGARRASLDGDPRLPILRALQRGEISVEEAGRRIDAVDAAETQTDA
jgi:hypothetical protein